MKADVKKMDRGVQNLGTGCAGLRMSWNLILNAVQGKIFLLITSGFICKLLLLVESNFFSDTKDACLAFEPHIVGMNQSFTSEEWNVYVVLTLHFVPTLSESPLGSEEQAVWLFNLPPPKP